MSVLVIVLLILLGLVLLIIEVFMLPGITIAGIAGSGLVIGGVVVSYYYYGSNGGHLALGSTLFLGAIIFAISFKAKTWNRVALKSSIDSTVEMLETEKIAVGDTAKCITRLNPFGKVLVNGIIIEAQCKDNFINENELVEVVKVNKMNLEVKPKI